MKKILFVPIILAFGAMIMMGSYYTGHLPVTVSSTALSPIYDDAELYSKSILVVHGTLTDQQTELTFVKNGNIGAPYVYTTWTLLINDILKGSPTSEKIQFKTSGGTYKNVEHQIFDQIHMDTGDELFVFLTKDPDSQWGNSYYLTGSQSGIYTVDEKGRAYNELKDINSNLNELKTLIHSFEK